MQPFFHPLDLFAVNEEANEGDNEDSSDSTKAPEASEAASGGVLEAPDVYVEKRRGAKRREEERRGEKKLPLRRAM